jgi:uncharacterized protein
MNRIAWCYCIITFLISWSISLGSYFLYKAEFISFVQLNLIFNLAALGPFLAALITAQYFYGKEGKIKLLATFNFKNLSRKSILISLSPFMFFMLGLLIYPLITGHLFSFSETQKQYNLKSTISYINWLLPFITYSVLEEFGWRGFLLPHLQNKYTAYKATIILTLFWASWHLPFFLWRFQFSGLMIVGFFISIFIGSLLLTSTFNFSKGSIVSTILFHFANNVSAAFDKQYLVVVVSICFVFLAIYIIRKYKPENLADVERVKNFYLKTN